MTKALSVLYRLAFLICTGTFAWSATVQILRVFGILDNVLFVLKIIAMIILAIPVLLVIGNPVRTIVFIMGAIFTAISFVFLAIYYSLQEMMRWVFSGDTGKKNQRKTHQDYHQEDFGSRARGEEYTWTYEQPEQKPYIAMPSTFEEACVVLGTQPGLDRESYKRIWRQEALRYHPDKTRDLGDRLQQYAEEEMKRINKAWEIIKSTV